MSFIESLSNFLISIVYLMGGFGPILFKVISCASWSDSALVVRHGQIVHSL